MLQSGAVLHGRWKVLQKIGQGAFGEAYSGYDMIGDCQVAIKLEKISPQKQVLRQEVNIIKRLQECPHVCRFYYCGRTPDFNYLVMELLGENLSEIRKRQPEARFSLNTTARLGIQMISALEQIHALGYLHRDFKPSNLAMGLGREKGRCYILDFGLSRRYLSSDGSIRPELSRRDDLWSFFYVMVEFVKGQLPWRRIRDKEQIGIMKRACDTTDLVRGMPPEFLVLYHYLHSLKYEDVPDYDLLRRLLVDVNQRENLSLHHPYDWELSSQNTCSPADHYSIKSPEPLSEEEGSKLSLNHDAADNEAEVIDRPSREQRVGRGDENDGANLSQQYSTMNASGSVPNQTTRRISMRSTENTWGQQTEHRVSFRGEQYREEFEESPTLDSKLRPRPPENSPPQGLSSLMKLKRIIQRTGSLAGFADVGSLSLPRNGGDAPAASPLDLNSLSARALFTGFASLSQRHSISHTDTSRQHDVAASKATPTQQTDEKQTHRPRAVSQPNDKDRQQRLVQLEASRPSNTTPPVIIQEMDSPPLRRHTSVTELSEEQSTQKASQHSIVIHVDQSQPSGPLIVSVENRRQAPSLRSFEQDTNTDMPGHQAQTSNRMEVQEPASHGFCTPHCRSRRKHSCCLQ